MNKTKIDELEKFYINNYKKIINDINNLTNYPINAQDVLHTGIIRYLSGKSSHEILYSDMLECCKNVVYDELFVINKIGDADIMINDPIEIVLHKEERQRVVECIYLLKPIYKDVLVKYYLDGMSMREISMMLRLKYDTINKRLRRGKTKLLNILSKRGFVV